MMTRVNGRGGGGLLGAPSGHSGAVPSNCNLPSHQEFKKEVRIRALALSEVVEVTMKFAMFSFKREAGWLAYIYVVWPILALIFAALIPALCR